MAEGPGLALIHYEVYTMDAGRWVLHHRFRREEREQAIAEAKEVEKSLNIATKVVRETYSPGENSCEEATVYISDKAERKNVGVGIRPIAPRGGNGAKSGGGSDDWDSGFSGRGGGTPAFAMAGGGGRRGGSRAMHSTTGAVVRLVLILAGAVVGAAIITGVLSGILANLPAWGIYIYFENLAPIQIGIFLVSFLTIALPFASSKVRLGASGKRKPKRKAAPAPRRAARPRVARAAPVDDGAPPIPEASDEAQAEEPKAEEEKQEDKPAEEAGADVAALAPHRSTLKRFLGGLVKEVAKVQPNLDNYNQFGVNLMLAGAVEAVGEKNNIEGAGRRELLAETLTDMGTKPETAKSFSAKYETYMTEPRYMGMVKAGRFAAESFLKDETAPIPSMGNLMEAWNKPQSGAKAGSRLMSVMFTDMVGSTDLTQARGDQEAQTVVRRHNSIVRAALAEFGGKEVKHTGDGIMASFINPPNGVEAAIAIQRAVAANNKRYEDSTLHLRIGINSGEPIQEDNDLFGATVQMAARVCAFADKDQIVCTEGLREMASGKGISFSPRGSHKLKGFSTAAPLYEVLWQSKAG